jgi:peptidoglycan hydrolase CwlO-like protein
MKNLNSVLPVACLMLISLSGCGAVNDMHDATMSMNKTTTAMAASMTEMNQKMTETNAKMTSMNTSIDGMHADMKGMTGDIKTMSGQMTTMNGSIVDMHADMKGMSGDIKTMSGQMTTMNTSIVDMHGDMKGMATDIKTMSGQMTNMNNSIDGMHGDMKGMATDIKTMSGQMTNMNGSIDGMHGDMKGMATDIKTMSGQMTDMNNSINGMHTDMNSMSGDIKTMSGQMTTMNGSIVDMHGDMKSVATDMKSMAGQMTTMNDNMVVMTNQMAGLSGDIKKMGVTLDLTHSDLRMIFTGQHRIAALDAMEQADDQVAKLGYAGEYMISHTYQAWNSKVDSKEARIDLMGIAIPDFFYKVTNYIHDRDQFDPSKTDSQSQNLYAITAALDFINLIELDGLKGSDEKPVTMLSMIEEGLMQKENVNSGKVRLSDLPVYQREVLNREQDAIYLLRVRQNFLKGIAYNLMMLNHSGDDPSKIASIWNVFKTRVLGKGISPKLNGVNVAQIEIIAGVLDTAYETEKFLRDFGVDPMNNKNVGALIRKMRSGSENFNGSADEIKHLNESLERLVNISSN